MQKRGLESFSPLRRKAFKWVVFMKLSFMLVFICSLQVSAHGYSQERFTLSFTRSNIEKVFDRIQKESDYRFFYNNKYLKDLGKVDLNVTSASLEDIMGKVLNNTLSYKIINKNLVVISPMTEIDDQTGIRGRITDNTGAPLVGVTIKIKGANIGVVTDANGEFSLVAPSDAVLIVSYIGYVTQEVPVNGRKEIRIQLKVAATGLNEVVVVGYGTQKKVDLTGAVDQVSGKMLQDRPITNVSDGLQGVIPNLNVYTTSGGGAPDATKSINIRGYTGLGSSASPLILVDGVPADINSVNPYDIESISVLKDAASSAIYGSRAPYGVILITTKHGGKNRALRVNLNTNFSFSQPLNVPTMLNSLQFANLYNEAALNANQSPIFDSAALARIQAYMKDPHGTPSTIKNPNNPLQWADWDKANANNDWFKVYLKKWTANESHDLSLDGGSEKISYFMGLGYTKKNGLYNFFKDNFDRYNMRANVTSDVNKWLTLGLKTSYAQENSNAPYAGSDIGYNWFHQIPRRWPTVPVYEPDGTVNPDSYIPEIENGGRNVYQKNDSWITGDVVVKPLPGWEINGTYSYNYFTEGYQQTRLPYQYSRTDGSKIWSSAVPYLYKENDLSHYHVYNVYTSYEKQVGSHYFKVLLGHQEEFRHFEQLYGSNQNLYAFNLPSLNLTYGSQYNAGDNLYNWTTEGTFMRLNYNYKDKYLLEFSGRYDGSSLFPQNTRYAFFPSASVGYNISKEAFWAPIVNVVNDLKFRASYGSLGDISSLINAGNYYPYFSTLRTSSPQNTNWLFSDDREPAVTPGGLVSPTITWAKPSMLDFGLDAAFLNNSLNFTFDWYKRRTTDLFGPPQLYPGVLGVSPPTVNNTTIETRGFDMSLAWQRKFGEVGVNARFILSNYAGRVVNYPNPLKSLGDWYPGENMGEIWGYRTAGLFQSQKQIDNSPSQKKISANWYPGDAQYADLNHDGKIDWGNYTVDSSGDMTVIGNTTPRFSYGFNLGLTWKGFDVFTLFQGVGQRQFFTTSNYFWGINGDMWQSSPLTSNLDRWTTATPNGYFPRYYLSGQMGKNMQTQTRYLLDAAYFRVKNLQIGYTLPESLTGKVHVSRLRIYGSVENLLTIAPGLKHFQVDPELLISNLKIYPVQRTFSVGINLTLQ